MSDPTLKPLPPAEAVAFFEAKGLAPGFDWRDVWGHQHAHAFTVAKMTQLDLLADVRASLASALAEGQTYRDWAAAVTPTLQARGWWGRRSMIDPLTGESRVVQLGSPRRLRVIFDTNMRTALAAGRWERIRELAGARPWLRYVATLDDNTREDHRRWHGTILKWDHPWWDTHAPPNGWFCRCTVEQLSDRDLERRGYAPSAEAPDLDLRPWTNTRTGEEMMIPDGIDPGFAQNVGRGHEAAARARLIQRMDSAPDLARGLARGMRRDPSLGAFLEGRLPGDWPAAVLDGPGAERIGAGRPVVRLSQEDVRRAASPITAAALAALPDLLAGGAVAPAGGDAGGGWRVAGVVAGRALEAVIRIVGPERAPHLAALTAERDQAPADAR